MRNSRLPYAVVNTASLLAIWRIRGFAKGENSNDGLLLSYVSLFEGIELAVFTLLSWLSSSAAA